MSYRFVGLQSQSSKAQLQIYIYIYIYIHAQRKLVNNQDYLSDRELRDDEILDGRGSEINQTAMQWSRSYDSADTSRGSRGGRIEESADVLGSQNEDQKEGF